MTEKLRIVPLGGLGEVGKNMMSIEYGPDILIVDAGLMFPESDMPGIDFILPDYQYLMDKQERVRAIVVTHGHEDHIGALPYFLRDFNVPLYATRLTLGLIEVNLRHAHLLDQVSLRQIQPGDKFNVGPFTVEPYHVSHSIPDSVGLGITTPAGLIVHSGDYKLDHTPVDGRPTDFAKLAEFGGRGVLALLADSTNADHPGTTPSERLLNSAFDEVMRNAPGRVIVATFASLISRIQQVIDVAHQHGRKVAIAGRTMAENVRMAQKLGYIELRGNNLVTLDEIQRLPAHQAVILATGVQGEPTAVLSRLATGQHRSLSVEVDDTVVLSSHHIPGNEEMIHRVINRLFQKGADVIYYPLAPVHVSGHASQEEQKLLLNILRPRFFVPIHGELRHLKQNAKLALEMGMARDHIAVVENGHPITLDDQLSVGERVPGGYVYVDGTGVGDLGPAVIRERERLAQDGFVAVHLQYQRESGQIVGSPRIVTRGFVYRPEAEPLLASAVEAIEEAVGGKHDLSVTTVETRVQDALSQLFYRETHRRPLIVPLVTER